MNPWSNGEEKRLVKLVNRGLSNREIARRLDKSLDSIDGKIKRIRELYTLKPRRAPADDKDYKLDGSNTLNLVGLTLYWSEGSKQPNRIVEFVNSDPSTVKIFMRFLRASKISPERLRARVKIYDFQNLKKCENFWSKITGIPVTQFQKPIIRKEKPKRNHRLTDYGTLTIRYNSLRYFNFLNNLVNELKLSLE